MKHVRIRAATPNDLPAIFALIRRLAEYEKLLDRFVGTEDALGKHLFGARPYCEAIVAEEEDGIAGFGLFFFNYSTFLTKPGIYLEDLFVVPERRGRGIGKALLRHLAQTAVERGCGRMEWSVLDWNEPAVGFYRRLGAHFLNDWTTCRMDADALQHLATDLR